MYPICRELVGRSGHCNGLVKWTMCKGKLTMEEVASKQSKDVPRATVQEESKPKKYKIQPASWTHEIVFIGSRAKV